MSYKKLFITIRRKFSSVGIKNTLFLIVKRTYDTLFYSKNLFFTIDLSNYNPDEKPINKEVKVVEKKSFDQLTETERKVFREYGGKGLLTLFEKRLKMGHRLFLMYLNSEVAGSIWIYQGGEREFFSVPLTTKDIMLQAGFTLDKFRRQGVFVAGLIKLLDRMKQEGFHRAFAATKEWNFSQNVLLKAGFKYIGRFREFKIFKWIILIWSDIICRDFP